MLAYFLALIDDPGDQSKFERIYHLYRTQMFSVCYHILKDSSDAEDALQNTFMAIARHMDKIEDPESVQTKSYLMKAATHTSLNMLPRKQKRDNTLNIDQLSLSIEEIEDSVLDKYCSKETILAIVEIIRAMDDTYRDVLSLHFLNGLSAVEIADVLHRKAPTIRQQLRRGKKILISVLKEKILNIT